MVSHQPGPIQQIAVSFCDTSKLTNLAIEPTPML